MNIFQRLKEPSTHAGIAAGALTLAQLAPVIAPIFKCDPVGLSQVLQGIALVAGGAAVVTPEAAAK